MAARAGGLGYVLRRYRRIRVRVGLDRVDPVAVGAHWRLPVRLPDGLTMDALLKLFGNLLVALAARQRNIEFENGRLRIFGIENFVRAVAIGADGGLLRSVRDRMSVNALFI